eukprot:GEMP01097789.1.p1 GENE.GEMP01097789.1~~GEMP01097789.1.p1  ORF type:complete len:210 (+),score=32.32 GEMP01097789.1:149-778(+)
MALAAVFPPTKKVPKEPCAICLVNVTKGPFGALECGHAFHLHCIKRWAQRENTCPHCKARFNDIASYVNEKLKDTITIPRRDLGKNIRCDKCDKSDQAHILLLCDGRNRRCNRAMHTHCAGLEDVPDDTWFCPQCVARVPGLSATFRKVSQLSQISPKIELPAVAIIEGENYLERFAQKRKKSENPGPSINVKKPKYEDDFLGAKRSGT